MLNPAGYLFLLATDSACASGAIGIHMRGRSIKWQLPLAFAVCDGIGSFLGPVAQVSRVVDRNVAQAITLVAYAVAVAALLIITKGPTGEAGSWLRRAIATVAVPVLLSADNFFAARALPMGWTLGILTITTAANSYLMALFGLAVGNAIREHEGSLVWATLASLTLFATAWVAA
jgi:hypothetical protein